MNDHGVGLGCAEQINFLPYITGSREKVCWRHPGMPSGLPSASALGKQGALCLHCPTACRGGGGEKEGVVGERASGCRAPSFVDVAGVRSRL